MPAGTMQPWGVERWGSAHLGDDGEAVAQVVEANCCYVHIVNDDLPSSRLQYPEQAVGEGGFSSPGPAHNPNLWKQLFRPADRAVETGQLLSILVWWASLPLPSTRLSALVPFLQLKSPGATSYHHPTPPNTQTEAKKKKQL